MPGEAPVPGEAPATLPWHSKILFGIGAIGEHVYTGMFNAFIVIFYNQALGLPNTLIGTAVLVALVGDAISDPAVGILSDRLRSPWGRRHPFLLAAPIPLALSLWCIFNPPAMLLAEGVDGGLAQVWPLFAWLLLWTTLSRLFVTLYVIPHLALGGELVRSQHERSQLFSMNTIFGYATGTLFSFIAWSYFLNGETPGPDGVPVANHLQAASYAPLSLFAAVLILVAISTCALGTLARGRALSQPPQAQVTMSLPLFFRKILGTLANRNYLFLLIGFFFFMISVGVSETLNVFVYTYFWELGASEIRWLGLAGFPGILLGAALAPPLMRRFDRRPVLLVAIAGMVLFAQLVVNARLLGLLPANGADILLPLLMANAFGLALTVGVAGVTILSMIGDVIDENELATGLREEGLFYSARAFFAKLSSSAGHFLAGVMLDWYVRLPQEAVPGQLAEDVVFRLGLAAGPIMALSATIALFFYARYRLSHARHAEIMTELRARAARSRPEAPSDALSAG
ncbi:MAG: MFS transporter [Pseudomonadota bacterium]